MKWSHLAAGILVGCVLAWAPAPVMGQEKLDESTIVGIVQSALPDIKASDIQVSMIKRLSNRTKVNLDIQGGNAILYLTWQRHRTGARWWFEKDADTSLVLLSSTTGSARRGGTTTEMAAKPAESPRTETIDPSAAPAPEKQEEQAPPPSANKPALPAEKTPAAEKPSPKPQEPPPAPVTETKPAVPEKQPEAMPVAAAPADNPVEKPVTEPRELPPAPAPLREKSVPVSAETATPGEAESPFVPIELATGPDGTAREFIATLVMILGKGEHDKYTQFLLRPGEMAVEVKEQDFQRGVELWRDQFASVHLEMRKSSHIGLGRIILQKPQTSEIERATLASLNRRIRAVDQVYTYVKINLTLDDQPAYISIGGLMHTETGWRIGGRVELVRQVSIQ